MIECVFTIDYEIYGNGEGSLRELVYDPAEKLKCIFQEGNVRFVPFVEVAELEIIEAQGTDPAIVLVRDQIRNFYSDGFELGLHLHPQWYNGRYDNGRWHLDYSEYNLCTLPARRTMQIIDRSISYLRAVLGIADFTPFSFRAGNWLFQPTRTAATILADRGIKVDSSVYKGALQHQHRLDYRRALKNGYFWRFGEDVVVPDPQGVLTELPIYSHMVPTWKIFTTKRIGLQRKSSTSTQTATGKLWRVMDFLRFRHPLKLDFCRLTISELTRMMDSVIREDQRHPEAYRPVVAIGHTKDLVDMKTVDSFLSYLKKNGIAVTTFEEVYNKCCY
jgi:hypothetical protein